MNIIVIGAGAYGIALASSLEKNNKVTLWTRFEKEKDELIKTRENKRSLPGFKFSKNINITCGLDSIKNAEIVIIAVPAEFVKDTMVHVNPYLKKKQHLLIATKGIDEKSGDFIFDIVEKITGNKNIAVVSGPSFAIDIISGCPIGLSLASKKEKTINLIKNAFKDSNIKLRETKDLIGISLCGAVKNIIAITTGMLEGLGANTSTRAMLITESLHDIKSMIRRLGGSGKSILSFAGFGDLLMTCTSEKSRNYSFGIILSKGNQKEIEEYKAKTTIEGLYTLKSIYKFLKNKKVSIPIIDLIYKIVFKNDDPELLLKFLMEKE